MMSRKRKGNERNRDTRVPDDTGSHDPSEGERTPDGPEQDEEGKRTESGKWTPELVRAAFQIQEMRDRRRSPDYRPDPRLERDMWTWRKRDGTERRGDKSAYMGHDTYLTGRLETEPDTIKSFRIMWEKRPQKAFTERGQDSYIFVGRHPRGFILTVYPTRLVDASYGADAYHTWWSIRIFLEGWARETDYLVDYEDPDQIGYYVNSQGERVYKTASYMRAMLTARRIGDEWKYDPDNALFPVNTQPMEISVSNPLDEPGDLLYFGRD